MPKTYDSKNIKPFFHAYSTREYIHDGRIYRDYVALCQDKGIVTM